MQHHSDPPHQQFTITNDCTNSNTRNFNIDFNHVDSQQLNPSHATINTISSFDNFVMPESPSNEIQRFIIDNNIVYQQQDDAKEVPIHQETLDGTLFDSTITAGVCNNDETIYTNASFNSSINAYQNITDAYFQEIDDDLDDDDLLCLASGVTCEYFQSKVRLNGTVQLVLADDAYDVYFQPPPREVLVRDSDKQWYINLPVRYEDGTVKKTRFCADPGANSACVNTEWAVKHFPNMIVKCKLRKTMGTPGGAISPKYAIWMTFPSVTGIIYKRRMFLVDKLPVDGIADINLLIALGYGFKDETPPVFRHPAQQEIELDFPDENDYMGSSNDNSNNNRINGNVNYNTNLDIALNLNFKTFFIKVSPGG